MVQENPSVAAQGRKVYDTFSPYLDGVALIRHDRLVPIWAERLEAMGYLEEGAVIGMLYTDRPVEHRAAAQMRDELARYGHTVAEEFATSNDESSLTQMNAAALRFVAAGVTHVVLLNALGGAFFPAAAEQQQFRPRYAVAPGKARPTWWGSRGEARSGRRWWPSTRTWWVGPCSRE